MTDVFVERHWDVALTASQMTRGFEAAAGCGFALHRVAWVASYVSEDARDLFCHFSAPDAESVRIALQAAGSPRGSVWTCTIHDPPAEVGVEVAAANVLVSRSFPQPVSIEEMRALADASAGCLDLHRVRRARTFLSADRRRAVCLYSAPDAESVRIAQRRASLPVERVVAFRHVRY